MLNQINIQDVINISRMAGKEIMKVYRTDFQVTDKSDNSPLTIADQRANQLIVSELTRLYPEIPYISEESKETPYEIRKDWSCLWLIDPLDGTKEFVKKNGEFTVNIALIVENRPVLGVVYIPESDTVYFATKGRGCYKQVGDGDAKKLWNDKSYVDLGYVKVVASRSHLTDEVLDFVESMKSEGKTVDFVSAGSSLKFCYVAEGKADVYPRFGPTMEWDTAAAQIVVEEAGKKVVHWQSKEPVIYNKPDLLNPFFLVA